MSEDNRKELEIISGDGTGLDISPAYGHLKDTKPEKKPKNVIVPKEIKDEEQDDNKS